MARAGVEREGVFTHALPESSSYILSESDFIKLRPQCRGNGRRVLPNGWDFKILNYIKKDNPFCVFTCKQNRVKRKNSRKKVCPFFRGSLSCSFPGYSVKAKLSIVEEDSRILQVYFLGKGQHRGDVQHGRNIKGTERAKFRSILRHEHPSRVHHQLLSSLHPMVFASGKRDGVGSEKVLQKISSEETLRGRPHVDVNISLRICSATLRMCAAHSFSNGVR